MFLAFSATASLTVIASAIALLAFNGVGGALTDVTGRALPAITGTLMLAEKARNMRGAIPRRVRSASPAGSRSVFRNDGTAIFNPGTVDLLCSKGREAGPRQRVDAAPCPVRPCPFSLQVSAWRPA
jgi:hypothetical protein